MTLLDSPRDTALDVRDPATGEVVGTIPAGSPEAADRAVRAARAAQPAWARRPAAERGALLKAAAGRGRRPAGGAGGAPKGGGGGGARARRGARRAPDARGRQADRGLARRGGG